MSEEDTNIPPSSTGTTQPPNSPLADNPPDLAKTLREMNSNMTVMASFMQKIASTNLMKIDTRPFSNTPTGQTSDQTTGQSSSLSTGFKRQSDENSSSQPPVKRQRGTIATHTATRDGDPPSDNDDEDAMNVHAHDDLSDEDQNIRTEQH